MKSQILMLCILLLPFGVWANGESESGTKAGTVSDTEAGNNPGGKRELLDMIQAGDIQSVEKSLQIDMDLDYKDDNGLTALHAAAEIGHVQLISTLLQRGVAIDPVDNIGRTPLFIAVENKHIDAVSLLTISGANPSIKNEEGQSPALLTLSQTPSVLDSLFQTNTVDIRLDKEENTLLHIVAKQGLESHVSALIELKADVNIRNSAGQTPLDASLSGNVSERKAACAALLLQNGASEPQDEKWHYITGPLRFKDYEQRFNSGATALHFAAERNHEGMLRYLIEKGVTVDVRDQPGNTPLHVAVRKGYKTLASILIDNGANINSRDYSGNTPIHEAVAAPEGMKLVELLIDNGAEINIKDSSGRTPLHLVIILSAEEGIAQLLIDKGALVDIRDIQGNTPLLLAIEHNKQELSELLLSKGAKVFAKNNQGRTPTQAVLNSDDGTVSWFYNEERLSITDDAGRNVLHHSIRYKASLAKLQLLLDISTDQDSRDFNGETPLHYAVKNGLAEHAQLLLQMGADPYLENNNGRSPLVAAFEEGIEITLAIFGDYLKVEDQWGNTPLFHAVQWENLLVIDALLSANADPNHHNKQGETVLHKAILSENLNMAVKLIEAGADPNGINALGESAVHIAVRWERAENIRLLASHGASLDIQDRSGQTPLHLASQLGNNEICEWLLNFQANPNIRDNNGRTPLFIASENNRVEAIKLLLKAGANLSLRDNEGRTALHSSIIGKAYDGAATLIDFGANVLAVDADNRSSFDLLLKTDMDTFADMITPKVMSQQDNQGNTLLHLAVSNQADPGFIEMLLAKGADKTARNAKRKTAYDLAVRLDHMNLVDLLK